MAFETVVLEYLKQLGIAGGSAAVYALTGYIKSNEDFDCMKLLPMVLTGFAVGILAVLMKIDLATAYGLPIVVSISAVSVNIVKGIYRRFFAKAV